MRISLVPLCCAALLVALAGPATAQPLVKVTVRSYGELTNAITRFATKIDPKAQKDFGLEFSRGLGLTNVAAIDPTRPWELAVWYDGSGGPPLLALKTPAKDITRFKESLASEGPLRQEGHTWSQLGNGVGMVLFRESDHLSETEKSALDQWKGEPLRAPAKLVELTLHLNEAVRSQAIGFLGLAKMSVSQAVTTQGNPALTGLNPSAMAQMVNAYFDVIETVLSGFQEAKLSLNLEAGALTVDELIAAKAGTPLAQWLQKPAGQLTAAELNGLDPEAAFSFAAYLGKEPSLVRLVQKFALVGFQMQGIETNAPAVKDLERLMEKSLPMVFSGSGYFTQGLGIVGAYRFPGAHAAEVYAQFKQFMNGGLQGLVGKDKFYSEVALAQNHHTVDGVSVDRFSMTLNPDGPLFKMPGQKEQMQVLWPNGKMEMDYALKDGRLLVASPDRMKGWLSAPAAGPAKADFRLEETTCVAGYLNLIGLIKQMMAANPMVPAMVKDRLSKLDPQGTSIQFQLGVDQALHSHGRVPLKLFQELGRLRGD